MIKENVKLKEKLSLEDKITLTKELVRQQFVIGEDNKEEYAPYLSEIAMITYFFVYCVDGLTFTYEMNDEGTDQIQEDIYAEVTADDELMDLYNGFFALNYDEALRRGIQTLYTQMQSILRDISLMVENKRQKLVSKREDVVADFLEYLKTFLGSIDLNSINSQLETIIRYAQTQKEKEDA